MKNKITPFLTLMLSLSLLLPGYADDRIYGNPVDESSNHTTQTETGISLQAQSSRAEETVTTTIKEESEEDQAADASGDRIYGRIVPAKASSNGIISIPGQSQAVPATVATTSPVSKLYQFLRNEGFSPAAAAGVLGNIERESSFNPLSGNESTVYGLFQMSSGYLAKMKSYCQSHGLDFYSTDGQMKAMINSVGPELFNTYTGGGCIYSWQTNSKVYGTEEHLYEPYYCWLSASMTLEEFKQLDDPKDAAEIWRRVVERNTGSATDISKRGNMAQKYYDAFHTSDGAGSDIITEAKKYLGNPYVLGGNSLTNGIDCSHYVCQILTITGHYNDSYRNSKALRTAGVEVPSLAYAQPGDVLCYNGHVAFYVDEVTIIHAATEERGIVMDTPVDIQNCCKGLITIRRFR